MSSAFDRYVAAVRAHRPRAALVLGSGFATVPEPFQPVARLSTTDIPGYPAHSVAGHRGEFAVGYWLGVPLVISYGRLHRYEGHPYEVLTRAVRWFAEWEIPRVILTNAAGGIRSGMPVGSLMPIHSHLKWLTPSDWRSGIAATIPDSGSRIYSPELLTRMEELAPKSRTVQAGCYAALTGPSYETPAEIRALQVLGVDAVGMSTAWEAEAAAAAGLEVLAISCITNLGTGLSDEQLSHTQVQAVVAVARQDLRLLFDRLLPTFA